MKRYFTCRINPGLVWEYNTVTQTAQWRRLSDGALSSNSNHSLPSLLQKMYGIEVVPPPWGDQTYNFLVVQEGL